jgi:hypothetical protein
LALVSQQAGGSGGGLVFFVTGATGADAAGSGKQQGSTGSSTLALTDAQSTVTTTPLVYQPGSGDGPGVVLGVWTGDEGGVQFVPVSDMEDAYDDGAPDGALQPFFLPGVDGYSGHAGMGPPNWGDVDPGFRVSDAEAAKRLTGLAKMIYDHGLPVSSRYADSGGRVIVYTFADGKSYMEPVEPPSEQYIDSAAAMLPGAIALRGGKGGLVASRAIAAEAIEDAIASEANQAAIAVSGGYLSWVPAPIIAILFGARPKAKPGLVDDATDAAKSAGTAAAKVDQPLGANIPASGLPDAATQRLAAQIDEIGRRRSLGTDPTGQWRSAEEQAALRLEQQVGQLRRDPSKAGDWGDKNGTVYDAVGPVPIEHFNLGQFTRQIIKHFEKQGVDKVVVDLAGLPEAVRSEVLKFVSGLSDAQKARMIIQF